MSGETRIPDFKALEALFKRFYKPLRAYAYRFVADEYQAEDIVQDVFLDIWQRHERIRFDDESIKSYLFKAVNTHAINLLNRQPQTISSLNQGQEVDMLKLYISDIAQNAEESLLLKELKSAIQSYIQTLPAQCHKIFVLSRTYGLKNREIAEQLGISVKAVEKQIGKALFGLKAHLLEKGLLGLFFLMNILN